MEKQKETKRVSDWVLRVVRFLMLSRARKARNRAADSIVKAFEDVDWTKQTFSCGNHIMKDSKGNTKFYPSKDIDDAIRKMNVVLLKLRK